MAKFAFALNQSLDGYVDHERFGAPDPALFLHHLERLRHVAGLVYGRRMYEVMRYWDDDRAEWGPGEREYAALWRGLPKWVVSRTLKSVGPNATLIGEDIETELRRLKSATAGEIDVAGTLLAQTLAELGLVDEYRLYLVPVVLGHGKPLFAGPRPPMRLVDGERIGESVMRLTYVPA